MLLNGNLILPGTVYVGISPTLPEQVANKAYVDGLLGGFIARSGDSMTGQLILSGAPTNPLAAATKAYVDSVVNNGISTEGGTFTGPVYLYGPPTQPSEAATKAYVDSVSNTVGENLGTGVGIYAQKVLSSLQFKSLTSGTGITIDDIGNELVINSTSSGPAFDPADYIAVAGGTMIGSLYLSGDPVTGLEAATKDYVDTKTAFPAFDVHAYYPGTVPSSTNIVRNPVARDVTFGANFASSYATASVAATAETTFIVNKIVAGVVTQIGTIVFALGTTTGTFTTTGGLAITIVAGTVINILSPVVPDLTLSDVGIALHGTRLN